VSWLGILSPRIVEIGRRGGMADAGDLKSPELCS